MRALSAESLKYRVTYSYITLQFIGNKTNERISKRVFQENKARQIFVFGKFGVLCFLETLVLRFVLSPYYRRVHYIHYNLTGDKNLSPENPFMNISRKTN